MTNKQGVSALIERYSIGSSFESFSSDSFEQRRESSLYPDIGTGSVGMEGEGHFTSEIRTTTKGESQSSGQSRSTGFNSVQLTLIESARSDELLKSRFLTWLPPVRLVASKAFIPEWFTERGEGQAGLQSQQVFFWLVPFTTPRTWCKGSPGNPFLSIIRQGPPHICKVRLFLLIKPKTLRYMAVRWSRPPRRRF